MSNSDRKYRYHCNSLESMSEELTFQERCFYIQEDFTCLLYTSLTAAFREYSGKVVKSQSKEKPSIRKQLSKLQEVVKDMAKSLSRNKSQEVDR